MITAIRATSTTLQDYLSRGFQADPLTASMFGTSGGRRVTLTSPSEMSDASLEGLSLWLYEVRRDEQLLNAPPRRVRPDQIELTPLPLRLHYLATPIINNGGTPSDPDTGPREEQLILGKVLQLFHTHPRLAGVDLRDTLIGSSAELAVRLESLPLEDVARVWWALQRPYQLSVCYEVTLVEISADAQPAHGAPVEEAVAEYGVIVGAEPVP
jgi:hypothetical protein